MSNYLCITVTFLDPRFHGRADGGEPEWPPSPLRLMQAIVAANGDRVGIDGELDRALEWLESQAPPLIVAPSVEVGEPYCLSVPNNAMDIVGRAWSRGNYFGRGDTNPATHRTMKTIRPIRLIWGDTVHYLWEMKESLPDDDPPIKPLIRAAKRMIALGWGVDLVAGHADCISAAQFRTLPGERWLPAVSRNVAALRTPVPGTLDDLRRRYGAFLHRIGEGGFTPVAPLTRFTVSGYRRPADPVSRPHTIFELRHDDGSFCRYPQWKLMHIAGMVRHLAKEEMLQSPPADADGGWVERYVVGHRAPHDRDHRQLSYLPLPSIGHGHADHAVRRVMIAAPVGDDAWLEHLALRLAGKQLEPERGDEFGPQGPPTLIRVYRDSVARHYTDTANHWASVTPVILPGHDDRRPAKTRKLIDAALGHAGIDQPCTYEWSPFSHFRNSLSAHKYDHNRRPIFLKPDYLQKLTAVHLTLRFDGQIEVPGPNVVGAGRHGGFGILAAISTDKS